MCCSQSVRVDHMWKNMWARGKRFFLARANLGQSQAFFLFLQFLDFFSFFGVMRMGLAFWENGCTTLPFFEACPYTLEGEIFHFSWSLEISFFSKFLC
jgi:hypothetical protein